MQEVESLDPADRAELRRRLDALEESDEALIREVDRRLIEKGLLKSAPPPITDWSRIRNWHPVKMEGPPLSELIIEERR
jgi:hypothetical protein